MKVGPGSEGRGPAGLPAPRSFRFLLHGQGLLPGALSRRRAARCVRRSVQAVRRAHTACACGRSSPDTAWTSARTPHATARQAGRSSMTRAAHDRAWLRCVFALAALCSRRPSLRPSPRATAHAPEAPPRRPPRALPTPGPRAPRRCADTGSNQCSRSHAADGRTSANRRPAEPYALPDGCR